MDGFRKILDPHELATRLAEQDLAVATKKTKYRFFCVDPLSGTLCLDEIVTKIE